MVNTDAELTAVRELADKGLYPEAARRCLALLRQAPQHIEANLLYGDLAVKLRRPQDAILIYRKLLSADPDNATAHDKLSYLYHLTGDFASARENAHKALARDPTMIESRLVLGTIAAADGDPAGAEEIFAQLRRQLPGVLHIDKAYLDALLAIGEFEKARARIHELLGQYPDDAYLHLLLARAQTLVEGEPDSAIIRALGDGKGGLSRIFQNPDDQVRAYMALFKLHSDLGEANLAFQYLNCAKAIRRELFPFEPDAGKQLWQQLKKVFTPALIANRVADASQGEPIFVVGMPRSGTTLLERVICSDPSVAPAGELPVVGQLLQLACARMGKNQYDIPALNGMTADLWRQLGEQYKLRARRQVGDSPVFVDKMPGNYLYIGFILAMLPNARIIHLSRHPIANCLSIYEQDFEEAHPWANDLTWLGGQYLEYRQCMDYWDSLFGDRIIRVTYESLVGDTQACVDALKLRLGLEMSSDGIESSQSKGHIITASQWQARQPVHDKSIARWERLRPELQPLVEVLEPLLQGRQRGPALSGPGISAS